MKIHIVQKGDTLWKLAEKYGVDFEQLKAANAQLSNPDMIMPGMKIKVPTGSVPVKKEAQVKEQPVQIAPQHVKEQPKKEVQVAPQVKEEPKMEMPQMPHMEMPVQQIMQPTKKKIDVNTYHTNVNFYQPQKQEKPKPKMPTVQKPPVSKKVEPKKEMMKPKKEVKPIKKETYEPKHYAPKQPMKKPQPSMPQMKPQMQQPMPQMKPQMQQPMPSLKPQMQQPMCPPEQLQPVTPLMPGCGPTQPFFGPPMQPDAYQPPMQSQFQGYQEPTPHFQNHQQMMPQSFQPDTQMPFYPQHQQQPMQQPPYQPQQMAFSPSNQMPMQQAMPHQPQSNYPMPSNDCCGPTHPVTYGPNGQMMPAQDAFYMQGYHETDDYDD